MNRPHCGLASFLSRGSRGILKLIEDSTVKEQELERFLSVRILRGML